MSRLPKYGSKMNKIKFGTTVEPVTKEMIGEVRGMFPDEARSTGEAIDLMFSLLMRLDPHDAAAIERFCDERASALVEEADRRFARDGSEELARDAVRRRVLQLDRLGRFLAARRKQEASYDVFPLQG